MLVGSPDARSAEAASFLLVAAFPGLPVLNGKVSGGGVFGRHAACVDVDYRWDDRGGRGGEPWRGEDLYTIVQVVPEEFSFVP